MKFLFLSSVFALASASASAEPVAAKTVVIDGVISSETMGPVTKYVADLSTAKQAPDDLNIILSSPGGSVTTGFIFIDRLSALKARGTVVKCYVADLAASMAFQILIQCDERHSLETSFLLWHRARVFLGGLFGAAMTGPQLYALGVQLKDLDNHIYRDVRKAMSGTPDHYTSFHFEHETLHTGANLAEAVPSFIQADADAAWLAAEMASDKTVRTAKESGLFGKFRFGELIYIWSNLSSDIKDVIDVE